jgi:hypothetical protein
VVAVGIEDQVVGPRRAAEDGGGLGGRSRLDLAVDFAGDGEDPAGDPVDLAGIARVLEAGLERRELVVVGGAHRRDSEMEPSFGR